MRRGKVKVDNRAERRECVGVDREECVGEERGRGWEGEGLRRGEEGRGENE